jgi:hypothetical protein
MWNDQIGQNGLVLPCKTELCRHSRAVLDQRRKLAFEPNRRTRAGTTSRQVQEETFTRRYGLLRQGYCNAESDVHQSGQRGTDSDPVQKVEASLNSQTMTPLSSWIMPMRPMGFKDDQCFRISGALSVTALCHRRGHVTFPDVSLRVDLRVAHLDSDY